MIDLSEEATWPNDLLTLLEETSQRTSQEKLPELKAHKEGSDIWRSLKTIVFDNTKAKIEQIITSLEIRAFHCTRLKVLESVRSEGLVALNPKTAKERVLSALVGAGVNGHLLHTASDALDAFELSGQYENRTGSVWFVLTKEMTDDHGCEDLLKYFGGEATRRALWHIRDTLYPVLETIGTPAVVECEVSIADGADFQISHIAEEFIRYGHRKYIDGEKYSMFCEIFVPHSIDSNKILDVWEKNLIA